MKILVVDDSQLGLAMMITFLENEGHLVDTAENGAKAIEAFIASKPDLILMDVVMPVMDGFEATSKIRALAGGRSVPIILISVRSEENDLILGVSSGADDYLVKPIHFELLRFKIRALSEKAQRENLLQENVAMLRRWRERSDEEVLLAKHVMEKLIRSKPKNQDQVSQWVLPADSFSGDIVATATTPGNCLHIMLADGTGHGLSAALCMMPVAEIFYAMTGRGFSVSTIAEELNRKMNRLLPTERFVAATLVSVDRAEGTIEIWNGGGQEVYFISGKRQSLKIWKSQHLPLGILNETQFDGRTEVFQWETYGQLFLYSDGLIDARDGKGNSFGEHRLLQTLASPLSSERFEKVREAVLAHLDGKPCHDDISLVVIQCRKKRVGARTSKTLTKAVAGGSPQVWKLDIHLKPTDMKKLDLPPLLLSWFRQVRLLPGDCQRLFLIISELYTNALDHGLLNLDSLLKELEGGFEKYAETRLKRLSRLKTGWIELQIERTEKSGGNLLKLKVKDSGLGFGHESYVNRDVSSLTTPSGRGITLIRQLSKNVAYLNGGSEVKVEYLLNQEDATE